MKKARAINRAKVLLFADEGYSNDEITKMSGVHRQGIWRTKKRYVDEGLRDCSKITYRNFNRYQILNTFLDRSNNSILDAKNGVSN